LLRLYNSEKPVSAGQIKSALLEVPVNFDDFYDNFRGLGYVVPVKEGIQLSEEGT
jgi:hypothetical protein